jgi:hypothetical protein
MLTSHFKSLAKHLMTHNRVLMSTRSKGKLTDKIENIEALLKKIDTPAVEKDKSTKVLKQKGDVVFIQNPQDSWGFMKVINIGDHKALTISLQKD